MFDFALNVIIIREALRQWQLTIKENKEKVVVAPQAHVNIMNINNREDRPEKILMVLRGDKSGRSIHSSLSLNKI